MDGNTPKNDAKVFGNIPGIEIGKMWKSREEIRKDGVHAMLEHGIYGDPNEGAYSIVLSKGYKDDKDSGNHFIYTGSGGKTEAGQSARRTDLGGPQVSHQTADNRGNAALITSADNRRPVRVIRGPNPDSVYAPVKGYRYDGLYIVDSWEKVTGQDGFDVFKFKFRRIEGQPPISGTNTNHRRKRMLAIGRKLRGQS